MYDVRIKRVHSSVGRVGLDLAEKEFYVNSDEHCSI